MEFEPESEGYHESEGERILSGLLRNGVDRGRIIHLLTRFLVGLKSGNIKIRGVSPEYFDDIERNLAEAGGLKKTEDVDHAIAQTFNELLALNFKKDFFYRLAEIGDDEQSFIGKDVREIGEKPRRIGTDIDIERTRQELGAEIKADEKADNEESFWREVDQRIADGRIKRDENKETQ